MFPKNSGFQSVTGYSFSGLCCSLCLLLLACCLKKAMSASFTGANLRCLSSSSFPFFYFPHATDAQSPEDVKLAALCNQYDFPGYGIYPLLTFCGILYCTWHLCNYTSSTLVGMSVICVNIHLMHEWTNAELIE